MIPRRRIPVDAQAFAMAWLAQGGDPKAAVEQFEQAFARSVTRRFAIAGCSGRVTLLAALRAVGAEEGTEVILPAYTLADLPAMLRRAGLTPVFVDIDPETFLMDPRGVERAITPRTKAIIPTDLFGFAAPWDDLLGEMARANKVTLIEDAAHAAGSRIFDRPVGTHCRVAFFSLETIKVMHSFGGGVVVLDDEDLAQSIRSRLPQTPPATTFVPKKFARNLVENLMFRTPAYQAALVARGYPAVERVLLSLYNRVKYSGVLVDSAYSGWQAAFALEQLNHLERRVQNRRALARRLMDALDDLFVFPKEAPGVLSNYYFLVGRNESDPKELQRALVREGIDTGALGEITDFCPPEAEAYPHAYRVYRSLLQLPFYEGMGEREMERIVSVLRRVAKRRV